MTKKPTKSKPSRALTRVAPLPAPIAGTNVIPAAVYYNDRRPMTDGPWKNERDKIAWIDPKTGLHCIILRQPEGHLAGFVAVGADHPLHGFRYDAVPTHLTGGMHNPLFHSASCEWADESLSICHVPQGARTSPSMRAHRQGQTAKPINGNPIDNSRTEPQHDDVWWFGFECDGPQDLIPTPRRRGNRLTEERGQVYRGEAFVYAEVTSLAGRLKAAERDALAYPATAISGDSLSAIHASGINAGTPSGDFASLPAPDAASISSEKKEDGQ
jgi:hypothetical protein